MMIKDLYAVQNKTVVIMVSTGGINGDWPISACKASLRVEG